MGTGTTNEECERKVGHSRQRERSEAAIRSKSETKLWGSGAKMLPLLGFFFNLKLSERKNVTGNLS